MKQFDNNTTWDEFLANIPNLWTNLIYARDKARDALVVHDQVAAEIRQTMSEIAGCPLDDWRLDEVEQYAKLYLKQKLL